jgi:hypothetical protein
MSVVGLRAPLLLCSLAGCLVTDQIQFPERIEYPPSIVSQDIAATLDPPTMLGEIVHVDLPDMSVGEIAFPVTVTELNTDQDLEWKLFVDCAGSGASAEPVVGGRLLKPQDPTVTSTSVLRSLDVRFPFTHLRDPGQCCKVSLLVTSPFDFLEERKPRLDGDLGAAFWWVAVIDSVTPTVEMTECP